MEIDYNKVKSWLAHNFRMQQDDPDFEDRYHDALECMLRYHNGVGTIGAIAMMFRRHQSVHTYSTKKEIHTVFIGDTMGIVSGDTDGLPRGDEDKFFEEVVGVEDHTAMVFLQQFIDTLSPLDQQILELRLQGMSYEEIANELNTNLTVVYRSLTALVAS